MMTAEHRKLLERAYGYAKGKEKLRGPLNDDERATLEAAGWPIAVTVTLSHDEIVERLMASAARFDTKTIAGAFVAGLGSAPRGRQPLITYAFARHLTAHEGVYEGKYTTCRACGIDRAVTIDPTRQLLSSYLGNVWNERPGQWWIDLEELARAGAPEPNTDDHEALLALLLACDGVDPACTPGQLEKQLAHSKVLPGAKNKYERYGILQALAETGVLPNEHIAPRWDHFVTPVELWEATKNVKGGPRSDIVLPLAGWRGKLGVAWLRAAEVFAIERPRS